MIKLKNMQKKYGDFCLECSMEVKPGCITGLIGPNGAGKSTTFKSILGLISIDAGEAEVFGKPVSQLTPRDRERLGVVLSDSSFSGYLTVGNLVPILKGLYKKFDEKGFLKGCQELELPLNKQIKDFSSGMKAKLKVLAAISHDADLLILDEPTAGLDVLARDTLLGLLREYMENGEHSILISSHISSDLEGLCDDVYMIAHGKIVLHEETDVLLSDYGILKVTEEQYEMLDKSYLMRRKKEDFGYLLLTNQKQFYAENYPAIVIEKGGIDEVITMMIRGEAQ